MKIALVLSCLINILLIGAVYILLNNQASSWLRLDPIQKRLPNVLETKTGSMQHTTSLAPLSRLQKTKQRTRYMHEGYINNDVLRGHNIKNKIN